MENSITGLWKPTVILYARTTQHRAGPFRVWSEAPFPLQRSVMFIYKWFMYNLVILTKGGAEKEGVIANSSGSDRRGLVDAKLGFDSFPDQASSCFTCADHKTRSWLVSVQLCCRIALVHSLFRNEFSAASSIFTFTKLSRQCFNCHTFATAQQPLIKSSASS